MNDLAVASQYPQVAFAAGRGPPWRSVITREVFLHDNLTGATTRVCAGLGGVQCDQSSTIPAASRSQ